jgi:NADH dehydrogenase
MLSSSSRRDLLAGAAAGAIGGLAFIWAMQAQGLRATVAGLAGLPPTAAGMVLDVLAAAVLGAGYGLVFRYQESAYAATLSSGVLYGLLWWIAGPLTLAPLLVGRAPGWALPEADAALPSLVGHILYGALTGMAFYALVSLYRRRRPQPEPAAEPAVTRARRVVILGGGFGGVAAAQRLEDLFARDPSLEIVLVSQSNYLLFTPMLAEVASSGLEAQHISAPVRAACPRTRFVRAEVEGVDVGQRIVRVRGAAGGSGEALPYDHLILALGSVPSFHGLPGLEDHAFTLKTLDDATRLRNHVLTLLERADAEPEPQERRRSLTFVVAGGGFAGAEMAAEVLDLVRGVLRYYPNIPPHEPRFVLVHSGGRILPEISAGLAEYALRRLQVRGLEFILNTRVAGATPEAVLLGPGQQIETRTLVWTAGNQPHPLPRTLPAARNRAGAIVVDSTLRVPGLMNVWAVGDCAQVPDVYNGGQPCPPTAQHALRQGDVVAANVASSLRGRPLREFRYRTVGTLVALGHRTAVAELRGWKFSGLLAWVMWRTVYLSKLPGLEKKVRVALDWAIDLFFPRDIVVTSRAVTPTLAQTIGAQSVGQPVGPGAGAPEVADVAVKGD